MNQLQERVRELEIQKENITIAYSTMVKKKLHDSTTCGSNLASYRFSDEIVLPKVTLRVSENSVMIESNVRRSKMIILCTKY